MSSDLQPPPLYAAVLEAMRVHAATTDSTSQREAAVSRLLETAPRQQLAPTLCALAAEVMRLQQALASQQLLLTSAHAIHVTPTSPVLARPPAAALSDTAMFRSLRLQRALDGSDASLTMPNFVEGSLASFVEEPASRNSTDNPGLSLAPSQMLLDGRPNLNASLLNASQTAMNRSAVVVTRGETLDSVNDIEFMHQIGHGAQATVWLCVDVTTGEERAVKAIDRSNCIDADFGLVEIEAAMRLQHDNVIRLYEVIDDPTCQAIFLVMEYVEGGASGCIDGETGDCDTRLTSSQVIELAIGAAQGLQYCHARGVVHGDIKPENVLAARVFESNFVRAVVADFGVAKLSETACSGGGGGSIATKATTTSSQRTVISTADARGPLACATSESTLGADATSASRRPSAQSASSQAQGDSAEQLLMSRSDGTGALNFPLLASINPSMGVDGVLGDASSTPSPGTVFSPAALVHRLSLPTDPVAAVPPMPPAQTQSHRRAGRRISLVMTPEGVAAKASRPPPAMLLPHPSISSSKRASSASTMDRHLSLRDVGRVLADKTRELQRNQSEEMRAHFAKRGVKALGGTPAFQAPELLEGNQPTPASDMWALGVTLYALVFKTLPWHGSSWFELKEGVCTKQAPFPASTVADREHRRWRGIIERLLDKDPMTRMTASELLAACTGLLNRFSTPSPASSPSHGARTPPLGLSTTLAA